MISDFHEKATGNRPCRTDRLVEGSEALLNETNPNLVLIGGDQCIDENTFETVKTHMEYIISSILKCELPWAAVFGNHDNECNCALNFLAEVMMSAPHCLMQKGDPLMGVGNYILGIQNEKGILEKAFIMLDSNHRKDGERNG